MLQRYEIRRDPAEQQFRIREYAVIDKWLRDADPSLLRREDYVLLHEAAYDQNTILEAAADDIKTLITALRTPFFFPNAETAAGIAQALLGLSNGREPSEVALFVNDKDGHLAAPFASAPL
ncbi:MAG TPA: hypothetical protein VKO20_02535 [Desulfosalsimonadaceae bacterium]|nr:hypothetical protein [Desulfosalsimonadaceae bacterium]